MIVVNRWDRVFRSNPLCRIEPVDTSLENLCVTLRCAVLWLCMLPLRSVIVWLGWSPAGSLIENILCNWWHLVTVCGPSGPLSLFSSFLWLIPWKKDKDLCREEGHKASSSPRRGLWKTAGLSSIYGWNAVSLWLDCIVVELSGWGVIYGWNSVYLWLDCRWLMNESSLI